jgi:hypothetical protein
MEIVLVPDSLYTPKVYHVIDKNIQNRNLSYLFHCTVRVHNNFITPTLWFSAYHPGHQADNRQTEAAFHW